jgi:GT2 family glycosyltransferase
MTVSVMITTRDRRDVLAATCKRLSAMAPAPDEVLICTDGCTDGTADLIRTEFPNLLLLENPQPVGSVGSRDLLLRAATGEIVVSLDDDSYPLTEDFFARLPDIFLRHPEAAVICFPELREGGTFADNSQTASSSGCYVATYANCAAAMRRQFYLETSGFPRFFVHAYEEPDYALQCYAAGGAIWFEPSLIIRHHRSAVGRSDLRTHQHHSRNELWSVWMRCPWPWLPIVSAFRVARQFQHACTQGPAWIVREPQWWYEALCGVGHCLRARNAIEWRAYLGWMRLMRRPQMEISHVRFVKSGSSPSMSAVVQRNLP